MIQKSAHVILLKTHTLTAMYVEVYYYAYALFIIHVHVTTYN